MRIALLDYIRFGAALMVVVFHYSFNGIANGKISSVDTLSPLIAITKYGFIGVEIFFLISGFVIFYSAANRTAGAFAYSRVKRLYPMFWFGVVLTSIVAILWAEDPRMQVWSQQIVANLTMVPNLLGYGYVDGVYWTLFYELWFYSIVFLALFLGAGNKLDGFFIVWGLLIALNFFIPFYNEGPLSGYFCLFVSGAIIAMLRERLTLLRIATLCLVFVSYYSFAEVRVDLVADKTGHTISFDIVILITLIGYLLLLSTASQRVASLNLPFATTLGALTYPVYLIHAHIGYILLSKFSSNEAHLWLVGLGIVLVVWTSYIAHIVIEERMSGIWKKLFKVTIQYPIEKIESGIHKVRHLALNQLQSSK